MKTTSSGLSLFITRLECSQTIANDQATDAQNMCWRVYSKPELRNANAEGLEKREPDGRVNPDFEIEVVDHAKRKYTP